MQSNRSVYEQLATLRRVKEVGYAYKKLCPTL